MQRIANHLYEASWRQHSLPQRRPVWLFVAGAAYAHMSTRPPPVSTESNEPTNDETKPLTFDVTKKWNKASSDGPEFFTRMILTNDSRDDVAETKVKAHRPQGEMSFSEYIRSKLLGQQPTKDMLSEEINLDNSQSNDFFSMAKSFVKLSVGDAESQEKMIQDLVVRARESTGKGDFDESKGFSEILSIMTTDWQTVTKSLDASFGHLDLSGLFPTSLFYYLEVEDERKNPSWKRRMHRFHKGIDINQVSHLNNMLYLSNLSYLDTVEQIADGCKLAVEPLELVYCDTNSTPTQPGHFIALKKNQSVWSSALEVVLVVRGTKTITDMMTDCMVDAVPYRGGKAHSGILQSGKWLVSEHKDLLEKMRTLAGKRRIKLTLVGHSLGAGAASIAGIEFDDMDKFDVNVVGFGCPSLLSPELARKYEKRITTVISDSDIVPRMSAATVTNVLLDIMEYDWTPYARRDIAHALNEVRAAYPYLLSKLSTEYLMGIVDNMLETYVKTSINKLTTVRATPELCPPGTCVHIYKDGSGIAGSIAPATFFQEIDITRTMVDDHLITSGYEKYLLDLMRQYTKDHNFRFDDETGRLVAVNKS